MLRIGVDLGGTKTEAVVLEMGGVQGREPLREEPKVLARKRVPTERERGYEHVLDVTRQLVLGIAADAGVDPKTTPIGVGMPGGTTMRLPDGSRSSVPLIKNSNTTCLNGRPFRAELAEALGVSDIAFANDANCFALAEATWGAAKGARVAFGVIMGSGVGGGLVFDGRAWDGVQGIAGEWGHIPLGSDGAACYCGKRGCIETWLAGPAIEAEYARRTGETKKLAEIATEDGPGATLMSERIELFGRALAIVINVVDPDVIVLGGGVSNLDVFYTEGRDAVARWIFNDVLETRIVRHALGDSAGVLGAALLPG